MSVDSVYDVSFIALVRVLERVERTSSRLEIIAILADYLAQLPCAQVRSTIYLMQGLLDPIYLHDPFQVARKTIDTIACHLLSMDQSEYRAALAGYADAADLVRHRMQSATTDPYISIAAVVRGLEALRDITGAGSVKKKESLIIDLCHEVQDAGAIAFLLRMIQGTLRAGFADMTLLQAIGRSMMQLGKVDTDKGVGSLLEKSYQRCADLGYVAWLALAQGAEAVAMIQARPGIPVMPASAERLHQPEDIIDKLGTCVAQPKLDGFRLQVHKQTFPDGTSTVHLFSRHLHNVTQSFPDIVQYVHQLPVTSVILEGEAIAYDVQQDVYHPFTHTVKRKRKHDIQQAVQDIPLALFAFDILYHNGVELLDEPHYIRRSLLQSLAVEGVSGFRVIPERPMHIPDDIQDYFQEVLQQGLEGLVVKKPDAPYQAGKRGFSWVKLKRHQENLLADTIDTVILGYYRGQGRRAGLGIGAFLVGIYHKEASEFQTIAKVGTGLTDAQWVELKNQCDEYRSADKLPDVHCAVSLYPDVWVHPKLVCEVAAEEITLSPVHTAGKTVDRQGYALRFPRWIRMRPDKSPQETTTVSELESLRRVPHKRA